MQKLCYITVLLWLKHIEISHISNEIKEIGKAAGMQSFLKFMINTICHIVEF
jgi:hypothetical protein